MRIHRIILGIFDIKLGISEEFVSLDGMTDIYRVYRNHFMGTSI